MGHMGQPHISTNPGLNWYQILVFMCKMHFRKNNLKSMLILKEWSNFLIDQNSYIIRHKVEKSTFTGRININF